MFWNGYTHLKHYAQGCINHRCINYIYPRDFFKWGSERHWAQRAARHQSWKMCFTCKYALVGFLSWNNYKKNPRNSAFFPVETNIYLRYKEILTLRFPRTRLNLELTEHRRVNNTYCTCITVVALCSSTVRISPQNFRISFFRLKGSDQREVRGLGRWQMKSICLGPWWSMYFYCWFSRHFEKKTYFRFRLLKPNY